MRVLAIDPSSSAIGWALVDAGAPVYRVASGVITRPAAWCSWLRVRSMAPSVDQLIAEACEDPAAPLAAILVEVPGTKQAGRVRAQFSTPGVYAAAVGMVLAAAWRAPGSVPVITVASDHWTKGGGMYGVAKEKRLGVLRMVDAGYDPKKDPGGDEGDAICLARWFLTAVPLGRGCGLPLHLPEVRVKGKTSPVYATSTASVGPDGDVVFAPSGR